MKPELLSVLQCPVCSGVLAQKSAFLECLACGNPTPIRQSIPAGSEIPVFTEPPPGMQASEILARSPEMGTPWRRANWGFLKDQLNLLPSQALILDVGAGRGDFVAALTGRRYIELEVYPYPEIDIVCDLTQLNPFRPECFDAILLFNVLEHVYDTHTLLSVLSKILKPGGVLLVAIPFMVKIHQAPVDYVRYTHYALQRLGEEHNLMVESLYGYYDPTFFLGEGTGNLRNSVLPALPRSRRLMSRIILAGIQSLANLLGSLVGPGKLLLPEKTRSLAPTGYHIVFRKPTQTS